MSSSNTDVSHMCEICDKKFTQKKTLYRHKRNIHNLHTSKPPTIICSICETGMQTYKDLRDHLITIHGMEVIKELVNFNTLQEFESWKSAKEKEFSCRYVRRPGYSTGKLVKSYYLCHRSGSAKVLDEENRRRRLKSQGSCKMGSSCPSTIEVSYYTDSGTYECELFTPHTHESNLAHIHLTSNEKSEIASKLAMGVSFDAILDSVRDSAQEPLERIHLVNYQDLKNIESQFLIGHALKLHDNDAISVDIWVNNMNKMEEDSPVVYYKAQGKDCSNGLFGKNDFMLILMTPFQASSLRQFGGNIVCIDSTHGTTNYDFLLTTLLVVDAHGEGFPAAYLLSNRVDTAIMTYFFSAIHEKIGPICSKVFMSDDDPTFHNAWVSIMPKPGHRLLCIWHVDRNWRRQLHKVHGNLEMKAKVYKYIRVLLEERNEQQFQFLLDSVLEELLGNDATRDFGNYFLCHYANRVQQWAYCHRKGLGINCNMYVESFHKILKHIYLQGKKGRRVDKLVNALMRFTRDKLFNRLEKLIKGKPSYRIKLIERNHSRMCNMNLDDIEQVNSTMWQVPSQDRDISYAVCTESEENCLAVECQLTCAKCHICVHRYSCTCPNYHVNYTICKHIHAVAFLLLVPKPNKVGDVTVNHQADSLFSYAAAAAAAATSTTTIQTQQYRNKRLSEKLYLLASIAEAGKLDDHAASKLERAVDNALCSNREFVQLPEPKLAPTNQNVTKQLRFTATKRKRKAESSLSKPSETEKSNIKAKFDNDVIQYLQ